MTTVLAIDPGAGGALCVYGDAGPLSVSKMPDSETETFRLVHVLAAQADRIVIERVHAMPGGGNRKMGASSAFSFGRSFGFLRAAIIATGKPWEDVAPQTWQKNLGLGKCAGPDRKRALRELARQRFPMFKGITLVTADVMLLAEVEWRKLFRL